MLAMKMSQVSGDMSLSSSEKLNKLIDELNHEADMLSECRSLHHIGDVMNEIADDIQKRASEQASGNVIRVPTGIDELDRFLYGGFGPGNLIVLAGRPSEGKSALMVHMAQAAALPAEQKQRQREATALTSGSERQWKHRAGCGHCPYDREKGRT